MEFSIYTTNSLVIFIENRDVEYSDMEKSAKRRWLIQIQYRYLIDPW